MKRRKLKRALLLTMLPMVGALAWVALMGARYPVGKNVSLRLLPVREWHYGSSLGCGVCTWYEDYHGYYAIIRVSCPQPRTSYNGSPVNMGADGNHE